jgi:hypothetical protein
VVRIADEEIERLKKDVDLAQLVIRSGVALKKAGADLVGCCPFHDDDTPSLVVTPSKNLWHCMGACQVGGSAIDWVMRTQGVSFRHAVEVLREGMAPVITPGRGAPVEPPWKLWRLFRLEGKEEMSTPKRKPTQPEKKPAQAAASQRRYPAVFCSARSEGHELAIVNSPV